MKLVLEPSDLKDGDWVIQCRDTTFQNFCPNAQAAILAVGSATYQEYDLAGRRSYNEIFAPLTKEPMKELTWQDKTELLAQMLGGESYNSGGNCYLCIVTKPDGRVVVFSEDAIAEYATRDALFEDGKESAIIYLFDSPTKPV